MRILALVLLVSALLDSVIPIVRVLKLKVDLNIDWGQVIETGTVEGWTVSIALNLLAIIFFVIYLM